MGGGYSFWQTSYQKCPYHLVKFLGFMHSYLCCSIIHLLGLVIIFYYSFKKNGLKPFEKDQIIPSFQRFIVGLYCIYDSRTNAGMTIFEVSKMLGQLKYFYTGQVRLKYEYTNKLPKGVRHLKKLLDVQVRLSVHSDVCPTSVFFYIY